MANHYLFPNDNKSFRRKFFIGFDVENDGNKGGRGSFQYAHFYGKIPKKDTHHNIEESPSVIIDIGFHDREEAMAFIDTLGDHSPKPCLVGFNTAYDYPFFQEVFDDGARTIVGSRFISGRTRKGIRIYDCTNFVEGSLENWIKLLKMEETEGIKKYDLKETEKRCRDDARATCELANFLQDTFIKEGIPWGATLPSCALKFFQKDFLEIPFVRDGSNVNILERNAYYGGRSEVFYRDEGPVHQYDVNSMYVSIMKNKMFPVPQKGKIHNDVSRFGYYMFKPEDFMYIADVTVEVPPDTVIGPLPYREKRGGKLLFPRGVFRTWVTSIELEEAMNLEAVELLNCHQYILYTQQKPFFKEYAEFCWNMRMKAKKEGNPAMDRLWKKMGNSLYGKFGQRLMDFDFFGKLSDFIVDPDVIKDMTKIRVFQQEGIEMLTIRGEKNTESNISFPCIPLFISAYGRLYLYRAMKDLESHGYKTVYTDTDSLKVRGTLNQREDIERCLNVGTELGQFKYEGFAEKAQFWKPKFYKINGDIKAKGIKKNAKITEEEECVTSIYSAPNRERESIRRGLEVNKWIEKGKVLSKWTDTKRDWSGFSSLARSVNIPSSEI